MYSCGLNGKCLLSPSYLISFSFFFSDGLSVETVAGLVYNPFSGYWHWSENTSLNYAAHAVRSRAQEHQEPAESALKGETGALHANTSGSPSVREEQRT